MPIKINPELQDLIPPLSSEEYNRLEEVLGGNRAVIKNFSDIDLILSNGHASIHGITKNTDNKEDTFFIDIYPIVAVGGIKYFYASKKHMISIEDYTKRGASLEGLQIILERSWGIKYRRINFTTRNCEPVDISEFTERNRSKNANREELIESAFCDYLSNIGIKHERQAQCKYGVIDVETSDVIYEVKESCDITRLRSAIAQLFSYQASSPGRKNKTLTFVCPYCDQATMELLNDLNIKIITEAEYGKN